VLQLRSLHSYPVARGVFSAMRAPCVRRVEQIHRGLRKIHIRVKSDKKIPPGFEKFFPEGFKVNRPNIRPPKNTGGPQKPMDPQPNVAILVTLALGIVTVIMIREQSSRQHGSETTFQDFVHQHLAQRHVVGITVENKEIAVAHLKPGSFPATNSVHFQIGSVDSFERNLENAQLDAGIPPSHFVPVSFLYHFCV